MSVVTHIQGREILDSRGAPALEVELTWDHTATARAAVPSGASTGSFEALELRDKDSTRFFGKGLLTAISHLENLSDKLKGFPIDSLSDLDEVLKEMDGTENKSRLGANTVLAVSLAGARAMAKKHQQELFRYLSKGPLVLPVPLINVLNGGVHASNGLSVQEFMIVPYGFDSFRRAMQAAAEVFHALKGLLAKKWGTAVGDEGGFAPNLPDSETALQMVLKAITLAGYSSDRQVGLALDVAASELLKPGTTAKYIWENEVCVAEDLIGLYKEWAARYPLVSIEDGLAEEDWDGWVRLTQELGQTIQLVGDDLFVTQLPRLEKGIQMGVANALLAKMNQVGTLSETQKAVELAHTEGYTCCVSHRSGETEDTSLADLAVAWGAEQVKTGSVCRGERVAKYNRFLRIEEMLGREVSFAGQKAFLYL